MTTIRSVHTMIAEPGTATDAAMAAAIPVEFTLSPATDIKPDEI
jgi:hypothetical protein